LFNVCVTCQCDVQTLESNLDADLGVDAARKLARVLRVTAYLAHLPTVTDDTVWRRKTKATTTITTSTMATGKHELFSHMGHVTYTGIAFGV